MKWHTFPIFVVDFYLCCTYILLVQASSVQVRNGTVRGAQCATSNSIAYLGIPYALPPVGNLRFAPPQSYNSTYQNGSLVATKPPPSCTQFGNAFVEPGPSSEDCLFLNIWTPPQGAAASSGLPVLFWIYGGSFEAGGISDALYDGCYLASDVVVVSVNYRLGPLGFLYQPNAGIMGNMAVQDLTLALNWVQENIASFGGDPGKVAVFGQSAGAVLTWILSSLPQAKGLMRAAMAESGAGTPLSTADDETRSWTNFSQALGCQASDINCFRSKSTQQLNASYSPGEIFGGKSSGLEVLPFVDGKIIPKQPNSVGPKVPLIAGTTTQEATIFLAPSLSDPQSLTQQNYTDYVAAHFPNSSAQVLAQYPYARFANQPLPAFDGIAQIETDEIFFCSNGLALQAAGTANIPIYAYQWGHTPSCPWYSFLPQSRIAELGATHTSEIAFVFNRTAHLPTLNSSCNMNAGERAIANSLAASWKSMAATGNPGSYLGDGQTWPQYNATSSLGMLAGSNATAVGVINYTICKFWLSLEASSSQSSGSPAPVPTQTSSQGIPHAAPSWAFVCFAAALLFLG